MEPVRTSREFASRLPRTLVGVAGNIRHSAVHSLREGKAVSVPRAVHRGKAAEDLFRLPGKWFVGPERVEKIRENPRQKLPVLPPADGL